MCGRASEWKRPRCGKRRKEPLIGLSRQQRSDEGTLSQALRVEVREPLCPLEVVSEWVTRDHAWGKRGCSLTHLLLVSDVITRSLFCRLTLAEAARHP
jgi:hypothetical protein